MLSPALTCIAEEASENARSLASALGVLPGSISISRFVQDYANVGGMDHYHHLPAAALETFQQVRLELGQEAERLFLRAALAQGIADLISTRRLDTLPPRLVHNHAKHLQRIATATANDGEWYDLANDLFLKDFGLVTMRLFGAAAQLLDVRCGIPRSLIYAEGSWATPKNILKFLHLRGFKPFIQIHTHLSYLDEFNEEGWNECYRCCSDLYQIQPELLGMFGGSWFYDPLLAKISPRLNYLRDIPLEGGAELFFVEKGGSAMGNALSTSPSRRELYEAGKYMPTNYMIAWGKKEQSAWASRNPGRKC